jgi:perosamine synthetase
MQVPFHRPDLGPGEREAVEAVLRGGWLTSGPHVRRFEEEFAAAVGSAHAVAVNSCTAALHLAVEALGLAAGQAVLVPTLTFAATAEVVHYQGALPILVDCDPVTGNMDLEDAARKLARLRAGALPRALPAHVPVTGMIAVHLGGLMMDVSRLQRFCRRHRLWLVEDAAHSFPAAWRFSAEHPWQRCGDGTARVSCFSFYANKSITTGEGGMAVTDDAALAERMRLMSLHGLSRDAWDRYAGGSWDYRIVAPGYKYNLTDIAAAIGLEQLARAEEMRRRREAIAARYGETLADVEEVELPPADADRIHAWHLFPIRLRLERLTVSRNALLDELKQAGIGCSVHWRPLHLHPYYAERFGWRPEDFPVATALWERLISLPLFPGMLDEQIQYVTDTLKALCARYSKGGLPRSAGRNGLRKTRRDTCPRSPLPPPVRVGSPGERTLLRRRSSETTV